MGFGTLSGERKIWLRFSGGDCSSAGRWMRGWANGSAGILSPPFLLMNGFRPSMSNEQ